MSEFLQRYAVGQVYVNGQLLAEQNSVSVARSTTGQSRITLHGGYAGESPGAEMIDIQVTSNFPSTYLEFDSGRFLFGSRQVEFDIIIGNQILSFLGYITSDNFAHAVNNSATISFSAKGRFNKIEGRWRAN